MISTFLNTPPEDVFAIPASFAQQRLWFLDQWEPGSPLYNISLAVQLDGLLHVRALVQSLQRIVERHEVLRTTFSNEQGLPLQVIAPALRLDLPLIDLSALPSSVSWPLARHLAAQEAVRPFDLERGPLLRVRLLRVASQEHVLLLSLHHIITDGWSTGILLHELSSLYRATVEQRPDPLPTLAVQYADYALWQREWLQGEVLERQLGYWRQHLAHLPVLDLPTDHPRPPLQSHRGATQAFLFPLRLLEGLRELSQREGVTLFMTLLASFQCLLARYSGQDDIAVGTPIANRPRPELETLIGCFLNTLVLRTDLSGNPSFQQVLRRVREGCLGAYAHQDLPFERLVEELEPGRDLSRPPLVQVVLVLQNAPGSDLPLPGLRLRGLEREGEHETAKFDLTLSVSESSQGLQGSLEYATELFEAETIKRLLGHLRTLLEGVVAHPEQRIGELPLLTQEEQILLSQQWNATEGPFPEQQSLSQCFEEQVVRSPEAVALVYEEQQVTYEELNERANQLAHTLREWGVGPEVRVGLCLSRSVELLIGLLAILKAGGAYVPLDPAYPQERLDFIVRESQLALVLSQSRWRTHFSLVGPHVLSLDEVWEQLQQRPVSSPSVVTSPANLAYVLFTSGSTGTPKGVAIELRSVSAFLQWAMQAFPPATVARTLVTTSVSFDLSIFELFVPLLCGGTCLLAENALTLTPSLLNGAPSLLNTVPSAARELLRCAQLPESLQVLNLAGEALSPSLVKQVYQQHPHVQVVNLYGPTEATTYATFARLAQEDAQEIPIGRPIANTQIYLLDGRQHLVPIGVPGEIYIGGAGLARGYLNRAEVTAERFVPDPFCQEPGGRLYRTGDLGRYRADGQVEYLGRLDHQVKVRGFRIELGEIETVLREHVGVREAVVVAREEEEGEKRLVAYMVESGLGPKMQSEQWQQYVQQRLPQQMVPAAFVVLEGLPLTPNGKVDRRALPAPEAHRPTLESEYTAPTTPTQELLAGIWQQVLRLEQVGIHDNFFALGGHSLLATQILVRIRHVLQVDLPLRCLFEVPTIFGFAQQVEDAQRIGVDRPEKEVFLRSRLESGKVPLSFAQQRLWFLDQWEPESPLYNVPFAVQLDGLLSFSALAHSLQRIVERHEVLRTTFSNEQGLPLQVIAPALRLDLPLIDLSALPSSVSWPLARHLAAQEAVRPFDLERGPLLRVRLLRVASQEHVLLLSLHHIITDGWSTGILLHELSSLYQATVEQRPDPLPTLAVQYADYALWQREWLQGEVLERQLGYWRQHLAHLPVLDLPTDHPRPPLQSHRGATQAFLFPLRLLEGLRELSQREGVTLFMTLLASFQCLLARYSGQDDIVVGTSIGNRPRPELETLIGCFINTLVLRTDLSGNPSFQQVLRRVREGCLGAYAHQDLPFERLVEELEPKRDLSRNALFQVLFELENVPTSDLQSASQLAILPRSYDVPITKFDLIMKISEIEQGLAGWVIYRTDLFEEATISRTIRHHQMLLEGALANPTRSLWELPLLTEQERKELLQVRNDTVVSHTYDRCFHELFEAQASKIPWSIAAIYEDQHLTYHELNRRANQLACYLQRQGVGPQVCVGVCMNRSLDLLVTLLGILKAGGAFLPLDPGFPRERMAFMLQDAQASLLLTQQHLVPGLPEVNIPVLCFDSQWEIIDSKEDYQPDKGVTVENLAFIIYTSGSTGKPKGVLVHHKGFLNYLIWCSQAFGAASGRGAPVQSTIAADAIFPSLFSPLLVGTCVFLLPESIALEALGKAMQQQGNFSLIKITPSQLETLVPQLPFADAPNWVRTLVIGAEALRGDALIYWQQHAPETILLNEYGPTETVVGCSAYQIPFGKRISGAVPLGLPISNTQFYVLDVHMELVPIGVPGELYIGGDGLAWGYLNRPELTAAAFIPNPFSSIAGARLYKTGDLVRYLPDRVENIEFIGRIDYQVKIRGFRIELGEIEETLVTHPDVRECLVIIREDQPGNKQLVAYVILDSGIGREQKLLDELLRNYLKEKLPEYMVPTAFVTLETFPLATNGKVDRRALPMPDILHSKRGEALVAPCSPVEMVLSNIWADVLGLESVGIYDNFFELGGHSLLAIQVIAHVRETLQTELPLRSLFENPTVAATAALLLQNPIDQIRVERTAQIIIELADLSDDEVEEMLEEKDH